MVNPHNLAPWQRRSCEWDRVNARAVEADSAYVRACYAAAAAPWHDRDVTPRKQAALDELKDARIAYEAF